MLVKIIYSRFLNDRPFKDCCMLIKIGKMIPQCPKWLPGDEYTSKSCFPSGEYTGASQLPSDEYTMSRLPCDEYTGESTSFCTLNKHQNRFAKKCSGE